VSEPGADRMKIRQKARTVQCVPSRHKYFLGLDGPPCPKCGSPRYEADP